MRRPTGTARRFSPRHIRLALPEIISARGSRLRPTSTALVPKLERLCMLVRSKDNCPTYQAPGEKTPTISVVFGNKEESSDIGVVRVSIPAGSEMPPHKHGGSDIILSPLDGDLEIYDESESHVLSPGDSILVTKEERVGVRNHSDATVNAIVAAGPANFTVGLHQAATS